jgi:CheY-like chemotaxis protein
MLAALQSQSGHRHLFLLPSRRSTHLLGVSIMHVLECPLPASTSAEPKPARRPALKVLCIDDEPHVVSGLARGLEARGAKVIRAYHGMQGFWLACAESPDVIVTDMMMPRGDGEYVIECLKRNTATRNIPIIVLSGVGVKSLERRVKQLDVESVFTKPAPIDSLYRAICALA